VYSLEQKTVLVTGGTGSFGQRLSRTALDRHSLKKLIVFSRDELKQSQMQQGLGADNVRFFIGDVRDRDRLRRAFHGVDVVVHAAALKQVPAAEYNPFEAVKTNVLGAQNVIDAAIDEGVERVLALSTDKAANPINLYGATKLCSDKLFVDGNAYVGPAATRFAVVRYGNVVGSRGSVIPFFVRQRRTGTLPVTDPRMTRFWITLQQGVDFVLDCLTQMQGGEIFVPKIPSMNIMDLARALCPECEIQSVGIRPGEKLHEVMVPEDDARHSLELPDRYIILPAFQWRRVDYARAYPGSKPCPDRFCYSSDTNERWLTAEELGRLVAELAEETSPAAS
jgi:UDP-N-acetylglucosamine 4,6-dehydratase